MPPVEYYSGRDRRRQTRLSSEAVDKIRFPKLTGRFRLMSHLSASGRLLVEAGGGIHMDEKKFVSAMLFWLRSRTKK
ncbi:hypothetical protein Pmar_PMAR029378 [Perkinsus marinus ATCC 50983]|uniref:Uncharacterized protein n=1 Tax=Perkinsus marinus (strain ATCC 50983 / TXsc) TaxID=423536 RepID=C5KMZ1_PERM5|nr:hypothetical protein Pmar_PMAR029378 [Perkinsus marinus ATCC 50983]EER14299.1 hypothetical protein Pmar_PMAR029378 [Perkinsus marinus ATCC 50983]|eukprot:XP_002782504.1 hypothetical protein Pmar_PMAR029378 [Perkinsus marinus ATCC 50983]